MWKNNLYQGRNIDYTCIYYLIDRLIEGQDPVRFIKAQRLRWLGHIERMPETQMPKRILKGRLDNRRRRGHPRMWWMDSVIVDLATMGIGMEDKSSR
jgi:hypothetical protein